MENRIHPLLGRVLFFQKEDWLPGIISVIPGITEFTESGNRSGHFQNMVGQEQTGILFIMPLMDRKLPA